MIDPTAARILLAAAIAKALHGTTDSQGRYLYVEALGAVTPSAIIQSPQPYQLHVHVFDAPGGNRLFSLSWPIAAGHALEHIVGILRNHVTGTM